MRSPTVRDFWRDWSGVWPGHENFFTCPRGLQCVGKVEKYLKHKLKTKPVLNNSVRAWNPKCCFFFILIRAVRSHAAAENVWVHYCFRFSKGSPIWHSQHQPLKRLKGSYSFSMLQWPARWPKDQFNFLNVFFVDKPLQRLTE